jgi:hypothetical protein
MRRFTIALFLGLSLCCCVRADEGDDLTDVGNGMWSSSAGDLFTRAQVWVDGETYQSWQAPYWYGGCYYQGYYVTKRRPGYYKYKYSRVLNRASPSFWSELAKLKATLEENKLKAAAIAATFPTAPAAYASAQSYAGPYQQTTYQQQSVSYGTIDLNAALQNYGAAVKASVEAGQAATQDLGGTVQGLTDNAAQVALYQAKLAAALKLLEQTPSTRTETSVTTTAPAPATITQAQATVQSGTGLQVQSVGGPVAFASLLTQRCASCHSAGKTAVTHFDVAAWPKLDARGKARVWAAIAETDVNRRMPKGGAPLTLQERMMFFQ